MRRFTSASSERIVIGSTGLAGFDWRWGTMAAVFNCTTIVPAGTIVSLNNAATGIDFYTSDLSSGSVRLYDGSGDSNGPTITAGVTYLGGFSKASGTATPRFHMLNTATGVWTHADGSGTQTDSSATTIVTFGSYQDASASDALNGELGAVACWHGWAMSDQEFERLAKGNWASRSPGLLVEFISAQDSVGDMPRTCGRNRVMQTARTGSTLGTVAKPAGWRPSVQTLRR